MILDTRLRAAANMVPQGARLADIGSDHAYLPIALCLENKIKYARASDINEGPVAAAVANIHKNGLAHRIEAVRADGLDKTKDFSPDCITILGMGGVSDGDGAAQLMLGKAYIEGLGSVYNPKLGYQKIYRAAIYYESAEAAQYLLANAEAARRYQIDVDRIELLTGYDYFHRTMGNLGTPYSHRVPLLLPEEN